jgi:hypothetical protein
MLGRMRNMSSIVGRGRCEQQVSPRVFLTISIDVLLFAL